MYRTVPISKRLTGLSKYISSIWFLCPIRNTIPYRTVPYISVDNRANTLKIFNNDIPFIQVTAGSSLVSKDTGLRQRNGWTNIQRLFSQLHQYRQLRKENVRTFLFSNLTLFRRIHLSGKFSLIDRYRRILQHLSTYGD